MLDRWRVLGEREAERYLAKHAPNWEDKLFDPHVIDRITNGMKNLNSTKLGVKYAWARKNRNWKREEWA